MRQFLQLSLEEIGKTIRKKEVLNVMDATGQVLNIIMVAKKSTKLLAEREKKYVRYL